MTGHLSHIADRFMECVHAGVRDRVFDHSKQKKCWIARVQSGRTILQRRGPSFEEAAAQVVALRNILHTHNDHDRHKAVAK